MSSKSLRGTFRPSTLNEKERTVEIVFTTGEGGRRYDWYEGVEYIEELDVTPQSVRTNRLDKGLSVIDNHNSYEGIDGVFGVTEDYRFENGELIGTARFASDEDSEKRFRKIVDGILRHVSLGYIVHEYTKSRGKDDRLDTYRATDWEPTELSFTPVSFETTNGVRNGHHQTNEVKIISEERTMKIYDAEGNLIDDDGNILKTRAEIVAERAVPTPTPTPAVISKTERNAVIVEDRKLEKARVLEIRALGKEHDLVDAADKAVDEDMSVNAFRTSVLDHIKDTRSAPIAPEAKIGLTDKEVGKFSLVRALSASLSGDWSKAGFERECSQHIETLMGREAKGFFLPHEIQMRTMQKRTMNVADDSAGGYLVQNEYGSLIEYLYANTVLGNAGVTILNGLQGDVSIPKQTGKSTFYWLSEDEDGTDTEPTLGNVILMPKTVAGAVPMTRKLLKQSIPSVEALVMNDLNRGLALTMDAAGLTGTGVDGQPLGLLNTTGIATSTIASAGSPTWVETVEFETDVDIANALMGNISWISTPAVKGNLKTVSKDSGSGQFIMRDDGTVNGYGLQSTTQMPANGIVFGDWSSLLIGMWGAMDVMADVSTKAASGGLVLRVFQDMDIGQRHIESFCKNAQ